MRYIPKLTEEEVSDLLLFKDCANKMKFVTDALLMKVLNILVKKALRENGTVDFKGTSPIPSEKEL